MNLRRKVLWIPLLFVCLSGCKDVIRTQPYFVGTFAGTYHPDDLSGSDPNNPPGLPIIIKSRLVSTAASRYTFEGAVSLDGTHYTMTGYEENLDGDIIYLQPQFGEVLGYVFMKLQAASGAQIAICGNTAYSGVIGSDLLPYLESGLIISGTAESSERCYMSSDIIGSFYNLQKQP